MNIATLQALQDFGPLEHDNASELNGLLIQQAQEESESESLDAWIAAGNDNF